VSFALVALILVVLMMAFGFGLLGFALSVVWSLIWYGLVGLVIGGLGRLLVSGRQEMGLLETALFGIAAPSSVGSSPTTCSTSAGSASS
jgi:hypothetical protein